ncbi:MAG TPA: aminotransferase class I/II-fold pyridoxal phosphate-dependent enzyme, partial [Acidimicrobiia bacterium]
MSNSSHAHAHAHPHASGLAILGGSPAFADGLPFVRPPVPPREAVFARLADSYDRGMLTNGPLVRELEAAMADRLGVAHVVAVSSCTIGLMLVFRVLDVDGPVLLPSFTFSASAHAVAWNGLGRRFAECDPDSFQLDLADAKQRLADDGFGDVGAILATHVFGAPCRPEAVEDLGASARIPVVFDAAHALGSCRGDRPIGGFGVAEVFSMTPTKPVVAGEGGLVATNDGALAASLRMGRDYGNPGNYDTQFVGLNGRMSELHAAVAL